MSTAKDAKKQNPDHSASRELRPRSALSEDAAMTEPEKLDLRSHDIAADKTAELVRLFPEIRTEEGKLDLEAV